MRVECTIEITVELNDENREVEAVTATCSRCGHSIMSYGTGPSSVRRCLALMREECEMGENNFYVKEE